MIFNSIDFLFLFLPVVFTLFWLSRTKKQRYAILTVSGYVFYGYWNWRFCGLLLLSSVVSFLAGIGIDGAASDRGRRRWMYASIAIDLSLLGFFKYYNFAAGSAASFASFIGRPGLSLPHLNILLPIGISFYTFHTMSYVIDVAAGRVKATRNLPEYLSYVSLFSQLVAGPIVRFGQIESDLEEINRAPDDSQISSGVGMFVVGLIKKVVIADLIARHIDPILAHYGSMTFWQAWLCALGYTFQLYYDFSGYSDMAMGLGALFGIHIPRNFATPYRSASIREFWRRWHISLSSWLRDYLYIPLGGNRLGAVRTDLNLLVTMALGGLWHGANWTFLLWGTYHGLWLVIERHWSKWLGRLPVPVRRLRTFAIVVVGWVLFRSTSVSMSERWLATMLGSGSKAWTGVPTLGSLCALGFAAVVLLPEACDIRHRTGHRWALLYAVLFFIAFLCMNGYRSVFLYYQF